MKLNCNAISYCGCVSFLFLCTRVLVFTHSSKYVALCQSISEATVDEAH